MKKTRNILIIALALVALAFIKMKFLSGDTPKSGKGGGQGADPATVVTAYIATAKKLDNKIFVTGTILANEEVMLVTESSGKVISINFKEGTKVNKGDLLLKINDADLQAQLEKLQIQEKLAGANEERDKKLLNVNGVSQMEYDAALTQLNSVKADIDVVKAQIAKTEIHAPFSGTIGLKSISEGSYVNSSTQVASLVQTDPIKIDFFIPEKYSLLIHTNDTLNFTVGGNNVNHTAKIMAIEPQVDVDTRTIHVRAIASNKDGKILPGSFAKVDLPLDKIQKSILIPTEAVIPILKGQKVFLAKNGKAEESIIQTGFRTDEAVQVLKGIEAGDTVITTGIMMLKQGSPLKIISVK